MEECKERKISRGDIYYEQKYPTYGSEQQAGRPAIVVSNDHCNENSEVIEVVYLTTQEKPIMPTHVEIDCGGRRSTVLCEQISSVSVNRLGDYKCRASAEEMRKVDRALSVSLDIGSDGSECEKMLEHWYPDEEKELALVCLKYLQEVLGRSLAGNILRKRETFCRDEVQAS